MAGNVDVENFFGDIDELETQEWLDALEAVIEPHRETPMPGDAELERKLRSMIRWNATAMVLRANRDNSGLGGQIASFASAATLYDVAFNHFFHAPTPNHGGDLGLFLMVKGSPLTHTPG